MVKNKNWISLWTIVLFLNCIKLKENNPEINVEIANGLLGQKYSDVVDKMGASPDKIYKLSKVRYKTLDKRKISYNKIIFYEYVERKEQKQNFQQGIKTAISLYRITILTLFLNDDTVQGYFIYDSVRNENGDGFVFGPLDMRTDPKDKKIWFDYTNDLAYFWPDQKNCEEKIMPETCQEYRDLRSKLDREITNKN